jgi:hypothetical protein
MKIKIAIAVNTIGLLCCLGMLYAYYPIILALVEIFFRGNTGSVAIIGGDGTSSAFSFFQPALFTLICATIFLFNLFVFTRKAGH